MYAIRSYYEPESRIKDLLEIKETGISIERFESTYKNNGFEVLDRTVITSYSIHYTKLYESLLVAGVLLAYKNRYLVGALISVLALSWMIAANHLQMTYYAGIMIMLT